MKFGWFNAIKNKNKFFKGGNQHMASTLEEVKKAYEDLSDDDKKSFHQSISDRVHESVAAQERDSGDEDGQSAADREHEALGEEHAEGDGDVAELHETDTEPQAENDGADSPAAAAEPAAEETSVDPIARLEGKLDKLLDYMSAREQQKTDSAAEKLDAKREKYGMGMGSAGEGKTERFTVEDVEKIKF